MRCSIAPLVFALSATTPLATAQQSDNLNPTQLQGRQLLTQACGVCHLQPTLGSKTYGPALNKSSVGGSDETMKAIIASGTERMPAFKYYLKPAEIDAIVAYVKTLPAEVVRTASEAKGEAR